MLDNNKCILAYKLSEIELGKIKEKGYKVVEVTEEMLEMKVNEILDGYRFKIYLDNPPRQKTLLFNNFSDNEINDTVKVIRTVVKGGILAIVTESNKNWKFRELINHLVEEREAFRKLQREK